jgi:uncharacterized protein YbjT (DUF2867 family)
MRITVIGATGRTGRHVVNEGLRRGYEITAFTRRPEALPDPSGLAAVVPGDGRDPDAVRRAVTNADAVIAIVTAGTRKGPHPAAAVSRVLSRAMAQQGVRRLVVTSVYPIVADRPRLPVAVLRLVFASAYADVAEMEAIVSGSSLDWTIVRLNRLTDKPARGGIRTSRGLLDRPSAMSRADAATTLLDIVADQTTIQAAINASGS